MLKVTIYAFLLDWGFLRSGMVSYYLGLHTAWHGEIVP